MTVDFLQTERDANSSKTRDVTYRVCGGEPHALLVQADGRSEMHLAVT